METFWQDVKFGVRMLARKPGFTIIAVLTLALGIGANTAIFSAINTVLLAPLPYSEPETIVTVWQTRPAAREGRRRVPALSTGDFWEWRNETRTMEYLAAYSQTTLTLTGHGDPVRMTGARVSADMFPLLRVAPRHGRLLTREEEAPGNDRVVLLSHATWENRFGSSEAIIGGPITLDSNPYIVAGVMPPEFNFPDKATEFWVPFAIKPADRSGDEHMVMMIPVLGRLREGVSTTQAEAEGTALLQRLGAEFPEYDSEASDAEIQLVTLHERVIGPVRPALLILMGAVGLVLLIACANVANLLLTRAAARQKEMSIRAALGAGRMRIIRQMLTESVVLSLLGGVLGVVFAVWGTYAIVGLDPGNIPRLSEVEIDMTVLGYALGLSLLTSFVFGLAPAYRTSRSDLVHALKEGGARASSGLRLFGRNRTRSLLVVAEIALALILLVGAGLLIRSFATLAGQDPGYNPSGMLTMTINLPRARYPEGSMHTEFYRQLLEGTRSLPGVESVGATNFMPLVPMRVRMSFTIEGRPPAVDPADDPVAGFRLVSPGFFQAMGIPLRDGRTFGDNDRAGSPRVAVISEALARQNFSDENPIGQRLSLMGPEPFEVIGVVGDIRPRGLDSDPAPEIYLAYEQTSEMLTGGGRMASMTLVVRTAGDPLALLPALRGQVTTLDPQVPIYDVMPMDQRVSDSVATPRFYTVLLGAFAGLALVLSSIGIYGVLAYHVEQSTHEIGLRMALGAQQRDVRRLVLQQGALLAGIGVTVGLVGAFATARFLSSLLFGITPTDPASFIGVAALLSLVAMTAAYLPARKATQVDPMVALRYE